MHAVAEIRIQPIGTGTSIAHIVEHACALLMQSGLRCQVHEMGTNVEGELSDVLAGIQEVHRRLHEEGITRLSTNVELETRTDKVAHLHGESREVGDFELPAPRLA